MSASLCMYVYVRLMYICSDNQAPRCERSGRGTYICLSTMSLVINLRGSQYFGKLYTFALKSIIFHKHIIFYKTFFRFGEKMFMVGVWRKVGRITLNKAYFLVLAQHFSYDIFSATRLFSAAILKKQGNYHNSSARLLSNL